MMRSDLINEINRIYAKFNLATPQVTSVVNAIDSKLSKNDGTGSLHIILGEAGCGISTATQMCQENLHRRSINTIVLCPNGLSAENNPWEALLDYYGLTYQEMALKTTKKQIVPYCVLDLIRHARIDCIIIDDFFEGIITPVKKQQLVNAYLSLARPPISVNIVVATTKRAYGKTCADDTLTTIHCIPEWKNDPDFSSFLYKLENILFKKHKIHISLRDHAETIFKLCSGNTGNLFYLLKEYAIQALLTPPSLTPFATEYLPLRIALQQNAFLFTIGSG